jgi:hypothetical protein
VIELMSPTVMGIVNVTPDNFSDGGRLKMGGGPLLAEDCHLIMLR